MEIDSLQEALRDFEKKAKKEACPLLEQFLCHIAKTGETMVQWSQFKNYFLFKLENVMDDFRAAAPDQRGPANPNVESIPFEDMKERILKIVTGYNGIPFTIQRLCELLTEPKRNYTGTDKFLRGVEKNVMVVSCVHPTSEKNGCSAINRMNGVMLPGNTSAFTERKVNGPGTPRPLNRPKVSLANSLAANGLPDSTDNKDLDTEPEDDKDSSEVSASGASLGSSVKNKHPDTEEDMEAEQQEVKRLKFSKDEEDEDDEEDEEDEQDVDTLRPSHATCLSKEAEAMVQEEEEEEDEEKVGYSKDNEASSSAAATEDQEPTSSTHAEVCAGSGEAGGQAEREVPCGSQDEASDMDQTEQQAPAGVLESPETSRDSEESNSDPVSSSSSSSGSSCSIEDSAEATREDVALAPSSSTTESPTEGAMESATLNTGTTEEPMEQD
ncbi:serine/threonine-protein phosphatase 4 regulatory subunit 2-B [Hippoglossus hippoglossus]|uniref:serine/threonine-protein phosphatase 4 regulatory subunit 2-B n=1 Tax=Hippoglossus hippoglossus TaxID=8267 RepID=UPI00148E57F6|nr:serine/threonine-protein phosphatase 4 regulatory subunit 2-B [Hippoglossus hippoglossus]XP_035008678.1 serine/threonine-protein phosphatase 4 regulatory subunit 2-B [Hippoglossus stenolepis]